MNHRGAMLLLPLAFCAPAFAATEFCLEGELDLGARYQGMHPAPGEFYSTSWCIVTEDGTGRVRFRGSGNFNPDMGGSFTVAYLPPDLVRIVNAGAADVEFHGADAADEASRVRRLDPRRLLEEWERTPDGIEGLDVVVQEGRVRSVHTAAEMPLRGRIDVTWRWDWTTPDTPAMTLSIGDDLLMHANGRWRDLGEDEAAMLWAASADRDPVIVPGDQWPASTRMELINLADDVYLVAGVRTGFRHLVVDTDDGLVIGDAPAGWVEFHHLPPTDLVPGLGVSGLSEQFVDFLATEFPDRPVRAVALTHFHDDHAGGARAFAAAGAKVYAAHGSAAFLERALNAPGMPADRLSALHRRVPVIPVTEELAIGEEPSVRLVSMGAGPHASAMLGVHVVERDYFFVSDVHVPRDDALAPRAGRETTECWFARWAVNNLPNRVRVVNSHSAIETPVSRLAMYLENPACR